MLDSKELLFIIFLIVLFQILSILWELESVVF